MFRLRSLWMKTFLVSFGRQFRHEMTKDDSNDDISSVLTTPKTTFYDFSAALKRFLRTKVSFDSDFLEKLFLEKSPSA